jgi:hypothetical protein
VAMMPGPSVPRTEMTAFFMGAPLDDFKSMTSKWKVYDRSVRNLQSFGPVRP